MPDRRIAVRRGQTRFGRSLVDRFGLFGHCPLVIALLAVVVCDGCRRQQPARTQPVPAEQSQQLSPDALPPAAAPEPSVTADQQASLQRIVGAGGTVEYDEHGYPSVIDLASDRVFADDEVVHAVLEFPRVRKLGLAVSNVTCDTLLRLASFGELDELLLQDAPLTDRDQCQVLAGKTKLERLTLRRLSQVSDAVTQSLVELPRLQVLALIEMNQISGVTLDQLRGMSQLRSLDLRNCGGLSAEELKKLVELTQLTELKLGGPAINDDVLTMVAQNPTVASLSIEDAQVSGGCLQCLAAVPAVAARLRSLSLARCFGVSDESLVLLREFSQLDSLVLRDILVTGTFLTQLDESAEKPLPLKTLIITKGFVDDASLEPLPRLLPQLTRLDLRGNVNVTDKSLEVFRQLRDLRELQLENTGVSDPGKAMTDK